MERVWVSWDGRSGGVGDAVVGGYDGEEDGEGEWDVGGDGVRDNEERMRGCGKRKEVC